MPSDSWAHYEASDCAGAAHTQLRSDLWAALDVVSVPSSPESKAASLHQVLGTLAGLLIAKWVGYEESEDQAIADFDGQALTPRLPEALRLPAWSQPVEGHSSAVAEALKGVAAYSGSGSAIARYLPRVCSDRNPYG